MLFVPPELCSWLPSINASGSRGTVCQGEAPAALENDLTVVLHLPHVGPVIVEAHVAHQQNLRNNIIKESRKNRQNQNNFTRKVSSIRLKILYSTYSILSKIAQHTTKQTMEKAM